MKAEKILEKAAADEEMTVEEIMQYREIVKPKVQTYGKYGTLAKEYLEKHNPSKLWALAGDLLEYLHNIDKQADDLYNVMYLTPSRFHLYMSLLETQATPSVSASGVPDVSHADIRELLSDNRYTFGCTPFLSSAHCSYPYIPLLRAMYSPFCCALSYSPFLMSEDGTESEILINSLPSPC